MRVTGGRRASSLARRLVILPLVWRLGVMAIVWRLKTVGPRSYDDARGGRIAGGETVLHCLILLGLIVLLLACRHHTTSTSVPPVARKIVSASARFSVFGARTDRIKAPQAAFCSRSFCSSSFDTLVSA
jgi:hypothetical protein